MRGWCSSLRQGRLSDSKNTYKGNYIYLPPKVLTRLKPGFSRIQDLSWMLTYHFSNKNPSVIKKLKKKASQHTTSTYLHNEFRYVPFTTRESGLKIKESSNDKGESQVFFYNMVNQSSFKWLGEIMFNPMKN